MSKHKTIFAFLACMLLSMPVFARPAVDRELLLLLNSATAPDSVVIILRPKDALMLPRLPTGRAAHATMMRAMKRNAQQSQAKVMGYLNTAHRAGAAIKATPLWFINAIVAKVPIAVLRALVNDESLAAIHANRPVSLIEPKRSTRRPEADEFTYGLSKLAVPELRTKRPDAIGTGVRVGILDTGIDDAHPDLTGRVVAWKDFTSLGSKTPIDDNGHGTHVAGTVSGGNTSGTAIGVAPGVKLVVGKVFTANGSASLAGILAGMQWMADPDENPDTQDFPALVSNSWGGGPPRANDDPAKDVLCQAVTAWKKLAILPVFAAGNAGPRAGSVGTPGACPDAFSVGATDKDDQIARFSSRGPTTWGTGAILKPEVSAPGVAVNSSKPGGGYQSFDGTSMATPHVAGLAALLYQVAPKATVDQIAKAIGDGVQDLGTDGPDTTFGLGRVNALKSVDSMLR